MEASPAERHLELEAAEVAMPVVGTLGGNGGDGIETNFTGTPLWFAGGGGGGVNNNFPDLRFFPGSGGCFNGTDGLPNSGGGGHRGPSYGNSYYGHVSTLEIDDGDGDGDDMEEDVAFLQELRREEGEEGDEDDTEL
ncbi:unnamed protein product [Symbiodinium sp. CCMP2456]|nr:unnamed protein product [Symbiodinium sp. CCMP2456]